VLSHLSDLVGSTVKVSLEIEVAVPDGVSDEVVRIVTENSRTLKFDSHGSRMIDSLLKRGMLLDMGKPSDTAVTIAELHQAHPQIRAQDWRSPLVRRLLKDQKYQDGSCDLPNSFRAAGIEGTADGILSLVWAGLRADYDQVVNTYQEPVITEFASLGLACILLTQLAGLEITEVTHRGERADYWLGNREFLLEVSGQQKGSLDTLCVEKAEQLLDNPFGKAGYVCVASYEGPSARLWFYSQPEQEQP